MGGNLSVCHESRQHRASSAPSDDVDAAAEEVLSNIWPANIPFDGRGADVAQN